MAVFFEHHCRRRIDNEDLTGSQGRADETAVLADQVRNGRCGRQTWVDPYVLAGKEFCSSTRHLTAGRHGATVSPGIKTVNVG